MQYPLTYLYLLSFCVMLVMTTLYTVASPPSAEKRRVIVLFALMTLWCLADLLSNLSSSAAQVRWLALLFAPVWAAVPPLVLEGVSNYTRWPRWLRHPAALLLLFAPAVGCVVLVEGGLLYREFLPASVNGMYFQSRSTGWQVAINFYHGACVISAAAILLLAARRQGVDAFRTSGRFVAQVVVPMGLLAGIINGGLSPLGVDLPFAASVLLAVAFVITGVGMLRRDYFAPVDVFRRERDLARAQLERREEVLSALSVGVAIAERNGTALLYSNPPFCLLLDLDEGCTALPGEILEEVQRSTEKMLQDGHELSWPVGAPVRTLLLHAQQVNYAGQPAQLLTLRDLTAHKQVEAELEDKRAQLLHAQKMEAIGRLSAGIAHDFNNQLSAILGNATLVADSLGPQHALHGDLLDIQRAAERASVLTRQLLSFGRKQPTHTEDLELNQVLAEIQRLFSRMVGPEIALEVVASEQPAWLRMDRVQLEQVLTTLVVNASDAMPEGGRITFRVRVDPDEVVLEVQDAGTGMTAEVQARAFEPFFSTKGEMGTGLGLATVYALVTAAGGRITVHSVPGEGATFVLNFPRIPLPVYPVQPHPMESTTSPANPGPVQKVMLVDDEDPVRRTVARMLKRAGFEVLSAHSGEQALEMFDAAAPSVDVVLTDLAMPGMDGKQLARALRDRRKDLPVVFMSGHLLAEQRLADRRQVFVAKPFRPEVLIQALRRALAGEVGPADNTPALLVVEDEPALMRLITRALENEGFRVHGASGVTEARRVLEQESPLAVLTDLGLDDGSGAEVLRLARHLHPGIACLIMSGGDLETADAETALGPVYRLPKPFTPDQLLRAVRDSLEPGHTPGAPHGIAS